jgi:hypothetical protein
VTNLPSGTYRESDFLHRIGQDAMGSTDTFRGISSDLTGGTATEASLLAQASASRAGLMFQILGDQFLNRVGRLLIRINELTGEERMIRVTADIPGIEGSGLVTEQRPEGTFIKITPEELASDTGMDLDLRISISETEPESRQFRLKRAIEGLQVAQQALSPADPIVERFYVELLDGLGETNPQSIVERGRALRQRMAQAQVQQETPDGVESQAQQLSADQADAGQGNLPR